MVQRTRPVANAHTTITNGCFRVLRSIPAVVWAATAAIALAGASYSLLIPDVHGPDERGHVDLTYQLSETWSYPSITESYYTEGASSIEDMPTPRPASMAPDRRASLADRGGSTPTDGPNHIAQHPPLYYGVLAGLLTMAAPLTPGDPVGSAQTTVGLLRLLNVAMVAGVPIVAFLVARRAGSERRLATVAALVPLAVPGFVQIGGVVNNDNLLPVPLGLATLGLVSLLDGDRRSRTALLSGIAFGTAFLVKATAVFFAVPVALTVLVVARRSSLAVAARLAALLATPVLLMTGWWYGPKLFREGRLMPSIQPELRDDLASVPPDLRRDFWPWASRFLDWTTETFVGRAGLLEAELPTPVVVLSVLVFVVLLTTGTVAVARRGCPTRTVALVIVSPLLTLYAVQAAKSWPSYNPETNVAGLLHGRYLYGAMVPFAVVVGRGLWVLAHRRRRWLAPGVLGAAVALQTVAAAATLDEFWGEGPGLAWGDLDALVAWSPWPWWFTVSILGATILALSTVAVLVWRDALAEGDEQAAIA